MQRPGWVATQPADHLADGSRPRRFSIAVNGTTIPLVEDVGGGSFLTTLARVGGGGAVTVSVVGWSTWIDFPLAFCAPRSVRRLDEEPQLALVAVAFSDNTRFKSKELPATAVDAVLKHALYHRCALRMSRYELIVRDAIGGALDARLAHYPWVTRLRPPANPNHISVKASADVRGNWWQAIYYNLAVLRHSGDNVALALWDVDEYLVGFERGAFMARVFDSDVLSISRRDVLCTNCTSGAYGGRRPDMLDFPRASYSAYNRNKRVPAEHFWQKSSVQPWTLEPKVVVQPERVHNMYVHSARPHTAVQQLPAGEGQLLHFYNLIKSRADPRALDETWEQRFHLVQPVALDGACWAVSEADQEYWASPGGEPSPPPVDPGARLRDALMVGAPAPPVASSSGIVLRVLMDVAFLGLAGGAAVAYRLRSTEGGEALKARLLGAAAVAVASARDAQQATMGAASALAGSLRARAAGTSAASLQAAFQARFDAATKGGSGAV